MSIKTCPDCETDLKETFGCGSTNYFCDSCKSLKSSSRVLEHNGEQTQKDT